MFAAALSLPVFLLLSDAEGTHPCADSALYAADGDFWAEAAWEESSGDACDPEESLLFPPAGSGEAPPPRESNRAAFSVTRNAGGPARPTLRQQSESRGWNQRLEIRVPCIEVREG